MSQPLKDKVLPLLEVYATKDNEQRDVIAADIANAATEVVLTHAHNCRESSTILMREVLDFASENQEAIASLTDLGQGFMRMFKNLNEKLGEDFADVVEEEYNESVNGTLALVMLGNTIAEHSEVRT